MNILCTIIGTVITVAAWSSLLFTASYSPGCPLGFKDGFKAGLTSGATQSSEIAGDVCCLHDVQSDCDPADDANSRQGTVLFGQ